MDATFVFMLILPLVAFLYAAVGHGGASGYLALMALCGFAANDMKVTALILNLFVAGVGFYLFWSKGYFKPKLFAAFALGSVPAAFIGGRLSVNAFWYKQILAILLLVAIFKMLNVFGKEIKETRVVKIVPAIFIGVLIGFFSGMIGIGGGVILSPVILILGWGKMKETAAVSALFIFVNSAAGLLGALWSGVTLEMDNVILIAYILISVIGGFLGAKWGRSHSNLKQLKYVLALVLMVAVIKLVIT